MKKLVSILLVFAILATVGVCVNAAEAEAPVTLRAVVLRPGCAGIYYKAELSAQTEAAAWGVALSTAEMPNKNNLDTKCLYTRITDSNTANSALLTDVLDSADARRSAENLTTTVYVRPYVETADGQILFGEGTAHTFSDVLTAVDEKWEDLTPAQQTGMVQMYTTHNAVMDPTKTPAIEEAYQESLQTPPVEPPVDPPVTPDQPDYDADTAPEEGATQITIGILTQRASENYDTNALTLWLEEQTGYDIRVEAYVGTVSSGNNTLNMMIAGAYNMPDILIGFEPSASHLQTLGQEGYFVDLSKYYQDADGASAPFWTAMNSNLTAQQQATVMRKITSADGNIYTLPTVATTATGHMKYQPWINTTWLDALGLEMPTNAGELYQVLKAFKEQDPNGNGKKDELPLIGTSRNNGAKVVDWLINMFCYYDSNNPWQPDRNGNMQPVFTADTYRMALQYVKKLYNEGLLFSGYETISAQELKALTAAQSVGVFVGDLFLHTDGVSQNLMQYEAMPLWGYAVACEPTVKANAILTGMCDTPNAAFKVMMALYSREGQERMRYGAYGVDWEKADAAAISLYGIPAEYKVINTPGTDKTWGLVACTFDRGSEGSLIQLQSEPTPVQQHLQAQTGKMLQNYQRNASWTPENVWQGSPVKDATTVTNQVTQYLSNFVSGRIDIYNDAAWANYLQTLQGMGLSSYTDKMQQAYNKG